LLYIEEITMKKTWLQ
jgi:hypothetical protein